ncbi:C-type lectin domain family 12 member B [Sarotherodon galilaeus]
MQCQFCSFVCSSQEVLLRHHQLRHRRGFHLPCVYSDCVCSFRTRGALKSHLSRSHNRAKKRQEISTFFCDFCEFKENCSQHTFISHLLRHLKNHETVSCPFQKCDYATNNLSTFTLISHANTCPSESNSPDKSLNTSQEPEILPSGSGVASSDKEDNEFVDYQCLEHKIARLFLCMQTLLHVSKSALQRTIEEISDILKFSQNNEADDDVIKNINDALFKTNPLIISTAPKGALSTD